MKIFKTLALCCLLACFFVFPAYAEEEWYSCNVEELYIEKLLEELYIEQNIEPMYAEGLVCVERSLNIRERPFCDSEVVGKVYDGDFVFITGKCNGYYKINDHRYVDEAYIYITEQYTEKNLFHTDNMKYLRIHYMCRIEEKVAAEGVTIKSSLWFKGDIPIYDIVDGYAYFPRGKNGIYKLPVEAFAQLTPIGEDYDTLTAYRTTYKAGGDQAPRAHNIALASTYFDGKVIEPGETVSFNKTTGPRSRAKGFQKANAFLGEEVIQDYGGGVCQISSTIYSAVRQCSGIEIVERRKHSQEVGYLPRELEATVNYPNADFKFKNNYDFPVVLSVSANVTDGDGVLLVTLSKMGR